MAYDLNDIFDPNSPAYNGRVNLITPPSARNSFAEGTAPDLSGTSEQGTQLLNLSRDVTTLTVLPADDLQKAIDKLEVLGGGRILLVTGTYNFAKDITIPSSVTIEGNGATIDFGAGAYQIQVVGANSYKTGTVTIVNESATVTGSGTTWTSSMVGQSILLSEFWYEITAVGGTTSITIASAFRGVDISAASYVIADTVFEVVLKDLTIQNATAALVKAQFTDYLQLINVTLIGGTVGFDGDDSSALVANGLTIIDCTTGMTMNLYHFSSLVNLNILNTFSTGLNMTNVRNTAIEIFCIQNTGATAMTLTNVLNCGFENFSIQECSTGISMTNADQVNFSDGTILEASADGMHLTNCNQDTFSGITIQNSGDIGVEMSSGNSDVVFMGVNVEGSTSDGYKLTGTTDRVSISTCSVTSNGGYGINIAAATCDDNKIIGVAFGSNSSGNVNDSGTSTINLATSGEASVQTFTSSGTWTKPSTGQMAFIQAWGGGGGAGGANGASCASGAGGGGGYDEKWVPLSSLSATETVTIGAGGTAGGSAPTDGGVGGTTTFGSTLTAYGGGGGVKATAGNQGAGGGGAGVLSAGSTGTTTTGGAGGRPDGGAAATIGAQGADSSFGGAAANGATRNQKSGSSAWGGGGGGSSADGVSVNPGGDSFYGGAGGGAGNGGTAAQGLGGTSVNGGSGGASSSGVGNGNAGSQPSGGGGGAISSGSGQTGGVGGAGKVIVTVI